jgi:hypothetical protein
MDDNLLLGQWHHIVPLPRAVWQKHSQGEGADLSFMSANHHRVRNYVVMELPHAGKPLPPQDIAQALELPLQQVIGILDDLERNMTFLFRNLAGEVEWAYPVTAAHTPHRLTFSTGEQIYAA